MADVTDGMFDPLRDYAGEAVVEPMALVRGDLVSFRATHHPEAASQLFVVLGHQHAGTAGETVVLSPMREGTEPYFLYQPSWFLRDPKARLRLVCRGTDLAEVVEAAHALYYEDSVHDRPGLYSPSGAVR